MKKNIGIFFGGTSVEHEISIITALQVIKVIDNEKYNVVPIYITKSGIWYTGNWLKFIDNFKNFKLLLKNSKRILPSMNASEAILYSYPAGFFKSSKILAKLDIAFPLFHGTYGEDGSFQGLFEIMNIPYVGSNVLSSSLCMNKSLTKECCKIIGIPVLDSLLIDSENWFKEREKQTSIIENKFAYPLIVKPNNLGSSIGVSKASNRNELDNSVDVAASFSNHILIEPYISALKEVNCSVMENINGIEISECEEPLLAEKELLSFDEKYLNSNAAGEGMAGTKRKIPAEISEIQKLQIQDFSKRIYSYLGCSGVVRIDFIIDKSTNTTFLNEINTIPGSLAFYLWAATNKKFTLLISEIIEFSIKQFAKKNNVKKTYKSNVLFDIDGSKLSNKLG